MVTVTARQADASPVPDTGAAPARSLHTDQMPRPGDGWVWVVSPAILLAGAGVYALVEGFGKVTFYVTPLTVGLIAIVAGLVGRHRSLLPAGIGIAGWGVAVALVHYQAIPATRTTPAYMIGVGGGILLASYVAPRGDRGGWCHSAAIAVVGAAIGFFLEPGFPSLGRWPAWAIAVAIWGAWELVQPVFRSSPSLRSPVR
jgi:hypothetical protein